MESTRRFLQLGPLAESMSLRWADFDRSYRRLRALAGAALFLVSALVISSPRASAASGDWPTYLFDNGRSGFNPAESTITAANASKLKVHWTLQAPGNPNTISVQPIVANGVIYWGSWNGIESATTLSGKNVWPRSRGRLGQTTDSSCSTPVVGVASTATVTGTANPVVYVGGGNAKFYSLDGSRGTVNWSTAVGTSPSYFIWSSPAVYGNSVYIGNASLNDCPLVQGQLIQLSASSGQIQNTFNVLPNGCTGGGVWGSPTIDEAAGRIYFATGNPGSCNSSSPYTEALIEVAAGTLGLIGSYQIRGPDNADLDFGSTPTLFQANGTKMVGLVNKDGTFYAFQRDALPMGTVWRAKLGSGGGCGECGDAEISPAAWDGQNLYVATGSTSINGSNYPGSLWKLDPATGNSIWVLPFMDGPVLGAVTVANGVAYVGEGSHLVAINTASGNILFNYDTGSAIWGPASVSNGVVYVGNEGGILYAFGL